jgi:hypothetical protein
LISNQNLAKPYWPDWPIGLIGHIDLIGHIGLIGWTRRRLPIPMPEGFRIFADFRLELLSG